MSSELEQLAGAYFHQDYDLEAERPIDVVVNFQVDTDENDRPKLIAELDQVLTSGRTEDQLRVLWLDELRASYDPARDGLTYRQWFEQMHDVLAR